MGKVISVISYKGGTGKTNCSVYLALILSTYFKKKVCIVDFCTNSDVANMFGKDRNKFIYTTLEWYQAQKENIDDLVIQKFGSSNIDFIPSGENIDELVSWTEQKWMVGREKKLAQRIKPLTQKYDIVIIDNHPNSSDQKNLYSLIASDHVLLTMEMAPASKDAVVRAVEHIEEVKNEGYHNIDYSIIPLKLDYAKGGINKLEEYKQSLAEDHGIPMEKFLHPIRYCSIINSNTLFTVVKEKLRNEYVQKYLNDYILVADEVIKRC